MSCLICLEELNDKPFQIKECNCTLSIHRCCYKEFLNKTKMICPICRINKPLKNSENSYTLRLMNLVFKLPSPIAIFVWFVISIIFSIVIAPLFFMKLSMENSKAYVLYSIYLYTLYSGVNILINNI